MVLVAIFILPSKLPSPAESINENDYCTQFSYLSAPMAKDTGGNGITSANVSQLLIIFSTFSNPCHYDQHIAIVTEVRDQDGATVFFQYAPIRASAFNSFEIGALWSPENAGTYELRSFAISNFSEYQILTDLQTRKLIILDYDLTAI